MFSFELMHNFQILVLYAEGKTHKKNRIDLIMAPECMQFFLKTV